MFEPVRCVCPKHYIQMDENCNLGRLYIGKQFTYIQGMHKKPYCGLVEFQRQRQIPDRFERFLPGIDNSRRVQNF